MFLIFLVFKVSGNESVTMGQFMKASGFIPELVISSSARRARKTAKRVCRELAYPKGRIIKEDSIYEASEKTLLDIIRNGV